MSEAAGRRRQDVADQPQGRDRGGLVPCLPGEQGESKQRLGRSRVPARNRVVVEILGSNDELVRVRTRLEESSAFPIGEQVEQRVAQLPRRNEPSEVRGRLVQGEEGAGQEGVIL